MSLWYQVPAYTRRGDVLIHLSGRAGAPPPPYELQGMVSDGEFNQRMSEVQKLLRRYSWSALERIFLVAVVLMSIVVPVTLTQVLTSTFLQQARNANQFATDQVLFEAQNDAIFKGRAIGVGSLVGILVLFWLPYLGWKSMGTRRMRTLLGSFNNADASRGGLKWTLSSTSSMSRTAVLTVYLSPSAHPTTFHPQAYLPAYMAKEDQGPFAEYAPPPGAPPRSIPVAAPIGTWGDEGENGNEINSTGN